MEPLSPPKAFAFDYAVVDAGVADYVGHSVDAALTNAVATQAAGAAGAAGPAAGWLPLLSSPAGGSLEGSSHGSSIDGAAAQVQEQAARLQSAARWCDAGGRQGRLQQDQAAAIQRGLPLPIQLIQGPPGTGKTEALAAAVAAALLLQPGCARVGVVSHTHSAIDNLLLRFSRRRGAYREAAEKVLGEAASPRLDAQAARMASKERWAASELPHESDVKRFDANYTPVG
jgi:hypothetical protein